MTCIDLFGHDIEGFPRLSKEIAWTRRCCRGNRFNRAKFKMNFSTFAGRFDFVNKGSKVSFVNSENGASNHFGVGQPMLHWLGEDRCLAMKQTVAEKEDVHGCL